MVSIAAGAEHSLVATSAGEVFSWGSTANGRLGQRHRRSGFAYAAFVTAVRLIPDSLSSSPVPSLMSVIRAQVADTQLSHHVQWLAPVAES